MRDVISSVFPSGKCIAMEKQSGVMLLEALIAVLIFSLGILSLVALQTASVRLTGDARYRAAAALAVERLFSEMRISGMNAEGLKDAYASGSGEDGSGGAKYLEWVKAVNGSLAGLIDLANSPPLVTVDATGVVTATLRWETAPSSGKFHSHTAVTQIY